MTIQIRKLVPLIIMLLLISTYVGCIGNPSTQKSESSDIPKNKVQIVPYVNTAYKYYGNNIGSDDNNAWYSSKYTTTYIWLDIRNMGRNNLHNLELTITNLPSGWKLGPVEAVGEVYGDDDYLRADFDERKNIIRTLYAQYDEETGTWNNELATTLMLRISIQVGIKGGYDYDGDGYPDRLYSDDDIGTNVEVGYFPGTYDGIFHVSSDTVKGDSEKVKIVIDEKEDHTVNYYKPY